MEDASNVVPKRVLTHSITDDARLEGDGEQPCQDHQEQEVAEDREQPQGEQQRRDQDHQDRASPADRATVEAHVDVEPVTRRRHDHRGCRRSGGGALGSDSVGRHRISSSGRYR
jgi:hypothetical protein